MTTPALTPSPVPTVALPALEIVRIARGALLDKKGRDIVLLDLRGISTVTDYALIVTGGSSPQLKALAVGVQQALKQEGVASYRRAGAPDSGWVVLDYVDVVIHIFGPQAREYYAVETLWAQAPRLK